MIMNKNTNINLFFDNVALSVKAIGIFSISVLFIFMSGCNNDKLGNIDESPESNVTMTLKSGTNPVFMDNASIYVFTNSDKFVGEKHGVTKTANTLFTYMPVGIWNLALLTCDVNLVGKISTPQYGEASTSPMWKTGFTDLTGDFLSQTPAELRYDLLRNTAITENVKTKKQSTLNRNVAKIQVILHDYTGFDAINPGNGNRFAFVDLLDVPTTLNWKGEYYPNKNNPDYSDKPIREFFNFKSKLVDGSMRLVADTVDFIVPAHRGVDAFDVQHVDTTTHKLRLRTSMPLKGQSYFGKTPVEISIVPKINRIIQLIVTFRGEPATKLDIKVTVKDWEDPIDQDITFD